MSSLLQQMRQDSPSCLWPLTEASGTTYLDIISGKTFTSTGTVTAGGRTTALGKAPDFAGGYLAASDDALFSPHAGASGLMTVEAWVFADTLGGAQMIVSKGTSSNYEYRLDVDNTVGVQGIVSDLPGNEAENTTNASISTGTSFFSTTTLKHLAFTYSKAATLLIVYVDGVERARDTAFTNTSGDGTAQLQVGHRQDGGGTTWDGTIQYVAIYPTALAADRLMSHYRAGIRQGVMVG